LSENDGSVAGRWKKVMESIYYDVALKVHQKRKKCKKEKKKRKTQLTSSIEAPRFRR